jgi:hypothetical protein
MAGTLFLHNTCLCSMNTIDNVTYICFLVETTCFTNWTTTCRASPSVFAFTILTHTSSIICKQYFITIHLANYVFFSQTITNTSIVSRTLEVVAFAELSRYLFICFLTFLTLTSTTITHTTTFTDLGFISSVI